jgi:hypothetical protein
MKKKRSMSAVLFILTFLLLKPAFGADSEREGNEARNFVLAKTDVQMPRTVTEKRRSGGMEIGLRFFGSGGILSGINHVNDGFEGINDLYADVQNYYNSYSSYSLDLLGTLDPLKTAFFGGMELFFNINPYIGLGFGFGYMMGKKESGPVGVEGFYSNAGSDWAYKEERTITQNITAFPINLTIYGGLPLGNMLRIVPYAGIGYYMARLSLENSYVYEDDFWYWVEEGYSTWSVNTSVFGFHGGLNFEVYFTRAIGLVLGIGGLSANFTDLVGDREWEYEGVDYWGDFGGSGVDKDHKLWYMEEPGYYPSMKWYPVTYLTEDDPNDWVGVRNVELGKISLSQFRFVVGIVIFFSR